VFVSTCDAINVSSLILLLRSALVKCHLLVFPILQWTRHSLDTQLNPSLFRSSLLFFFVRFVSDRSTIQVKTHAQVMMKKQQQGVNIFEELDNFESAGGEREAGSGGRGGKLFASSFPLPKTIKGETKIPNVCLSEEARYTNKPRRQGQRSPKRRHGSSFPRSNDADKTFRPAPLPVPPPFQPVTTTTVTTTMVGNHNHHNPFHHQGHHHYGAPHHDHNQHHHPYRYTPSFDGIATAASAAAAAAASSALYPPPQPHFRHQSSAFQAPVAVAANHLSGVSQDYFAPSTSTRGNDVLQSLAAAKNSEDYRTGTELFDAEVQAIEALLDIRAARDEDPPRKKPPRKTNRAKST
jgi:hypothetical protein